MEKLRELASTFLSEDYFWSIIENSDKGKNLANELEKLSEKELLGYVYWWDYFHIKSYNGSLWAVAYTVLSGCSDDGFDYFRYWLVSRGKAVYMEAIKNADSLCEEFENLTDDGYPMHEELAYVPNGIFERKFNKNFYDAVESNIDYSEISRPEIIFEWDEDDEESIRKVCPKTFDKWWNNDVF